MTSRAGWPREASGARTRGRLHIDAESGEPARREALDDVDEARLRVAIVRACIALGIPRFSPHDLRHRRIPLLHPQGKSWATIGAFVGQRKLSVTADTYTHVLLDDREVDYDELLTRAGNPRLVRGGACLSGASTLRKCD